MKLITGTVLTFVCATAALAGESFDIDFKGGSLAEWVGAVQKASPDCNIVLLHADASLKVPAVSLVGVSAESCAYLTGALPGIDVARVESAANTKPVWVIQQASSRRAGRGQGPVETGHRTSVFAIPSSYRTQLAAAELQHAIESICDLGGLPHPEILMNVNIGLLAVRGVPAQLAVVSETLQELPVRTARHAAQPTAANVNPRAAIAAAD